MDPLEFCGATSEFKTATRCSGLKNRRPLRMKDHSMDVFLVNEV